MGKRWLLLVIVSVCLLAGCQPSPGAPAPAATATPGGQPPTSAPLPPTVAPAATAKSQPPTATLAPSAAPSPTVSQPTTVAPSPTRAPLPTVASQPTTAQPVVTAKLGSAFPLKIGQTASLPDENLKVELVELVSDSRCPQSVTCVRAGEVVIRVRLAQGATALGEVTLSSQNKTTAVKSVAGYSVALVNVAPPRATPQEILLAQYTMTLNVMKG